MKPSADFAIIDITNTSRSVYETQYTFGLQVSSGDIYRGIMVGSGTGAVSNSDYKLGTQILHGSTAGLLQHGAMEVADPMIVGANVDCQYVRRFANHSTGTVTVKEIGIYTQFTGNAWYFCIVRDLLGTPDDILDGEAYVVEYIFRTTV
jgi:hypothetical protein